MTVDREVTFEGEPPGAGSIVRVSRATMLAYATVGVALVGWFFFGWLVLRQGFVDSVGESFGTAFAFLLAVSVAGTVRRGRRR